MAVLPGNMKIQVMGLNTVTDDKDIGVERVPSTAILEPLPYQRGDRPGGWRQRWR